MKRAKNLFDRIASFENLWLASRRARRGKRFRDDVAAFEFHLESELALLSEELRDGSWQPGPYRRFIVREPKQRLVSAAPYRDRVVHHALMNVLEPIHDRGFIFDSYCCRKGKGTHRALARARRFLRSSRFALHCDVVKFFPGIDHGVLVRKLERRIGDERVLAICRRIIAHGVVDQGGGEPASCAQPCLPFAPTRGLPIGNLTSQVWANVYLDDLDHLVKERLGVRRYVRYGDDLVVFGDDRAEMLEWRSRIIEHLHSLELRLHEERAVVVPARSGIAFLGFRLERHRARLKRDAARRFRRRLLERQEQYALGRIDFRALHASVTSLVVHSSWGDTGALRRRALEGMVFRRGAGPGQPASFAAAVGTTTASTRDAPTAT